jgi:hypothetical protein
VVATGFVTQDAKRETRKKANTGNLTTDFQGWKEGDGEKGLEEG